MTLSAEEQSENCSFGVRKSFAQVRSQFSFVCCYLVCGWFSSFYIFFIFFIFSSLSFFFFTFFFYIFYIFLPFYLFLSPPLFFLPFSFISFSFSSFSYFFPFYLFLFLPLSFKLALVSDSSVKRLNRHQNCFPTGTGRFRQVPTAAVLFAPVFRAKPRKTEPVSPGGWMDGWMDRRTDGWMDLVPRQTSRWELLPDPAALWRFLAKTKNKDNNKKKRRAAMRGGLVWKHKTIFS